MIASPLYPMLAAINHLVASTPVHAERLRAHAGRRIDLHVAPLPSRQVLVDSSGRLIEPSATGPADLSVRGSVLDALVPGLDRGERIGRFRFEGDAVLAQDLRSVLAQLAWDAEDDLARLVGDIPARRLADAVTTIRDQGRSSVGRLFANLGEYVAEERQAALSRTRLEAFAAEIAACREAVDRLEARIDGLARPGGPATGGHT